MGVSGGGAQGPTRTIWQGPRRPLHKWPLLKSAPGYFLDRSKEETADEVGDGFAARQQRERLAELVIADHLADDRLGTGDNQSKQVSTPEFARDSVSK